MYQDLSGKTALITGSGKRTGIGYAMASTLASCGANILIADLGRRDYPGCAVQTGNREEMEDIVSELKTQFGVRALALDLDVSNTSSVTDMARSAEKIFPKIHVLCNNAGASFGVPSPIATYDEEAWKRTLDVNLNGVFRVSQAILPLMPSGASIINTASRAGKVPPLFNGAYAVAKAGLIMLTKVMAKELAGAGIRVNAICPGQIRTDLETWRFELEARFFGTTAQAREEEMCRTIPLARIGTPDEVAQLVAFLASGASSYMTGQAINITGGQLMEI